jgi:hypothetical protein
MIDSGVTDADLQLPKLNTNFKREKAREKKIKEIWAKIEPNYKGGLKGNMYYSFLSELIGRNSIYENLLKTFKPFRKYQKYEKGGTTDSSDKDIMTNDEVSKFEKGNYIHYNIMNGSWQVFNGNKAKSFWSQEQAEKFAGFEYDSDQDVRYSRKKYEGLYAKGGTTDSSDKKYSALKSGTRKSSKYAHVEMRGGRVYHRRNANQYGKAKGGKTYVENRENRSDKRVYLEKGGNISGFEAIIKKALKENNKWHFINEDVNGKNVQLKMYVGAKEVDVQIFKINGIHHGKMNYQNKTKTLAMIMGELK